ncbi:C1q-like domain-containing protein [Endothiovibrio diazotrophicus]
MNNIGKVIRIVAVLSLLIGAANPTTAWAQAPAVINFQGKLSDVSGVPLSGQYSITFVIYDVAVGGTPLWVESHDFVDVKRGLFNVLLGDGTTPPFSTLFTGGDYWLEVQVAGDAPMVPRQRIGSVAYSFHSDHADVADTVVNETDPTVAPEVKDGVVWSEVGDMPAGFADGVDDVGIVTETDPTVPATLKDGVSWGEVAGIPAGFADGVDDVGLTVESDPKVGAVIADRWCRGSGAQVVCDRQAPVDTLASLQCTTDQVARYDGGAWVCADASGAAAAGGGGGSRPAKVTISSEFWLPPGAQLALPFDQVVYDDKGDFDTSNGRYVVAANGVYHFDFGAFFAAVDSGHVAEIAIRKNGTELLGREHDVSYAANHNQSTVLSLDAKLNAGDYVEFLVHCESGTSIRAGKQATWVDVHDVPGVSSVGSAWAEPPLLNGWVNYGYDGNDYATVAYRKDGEGFVHLRGLVKNGTGVIFNLPPGYRPAKNEVFPTVAFNGAFMFGRVDVNGMNGVQASDGDVIVHAGSGWVTLSGIIFQADH